ncbi:MAG: DUF4160 domain-containing protein, partial [Dehalococcoidales bacterium]|nr:DUF4160 domain-containing protein [Dehalococcoidales bacterium]
KNFKLFFYSNEGNPREPLHIHIRKGEAVAKFWMVPEVKLANSYGLTSSELSELAGVVDNNREIIERAWHEFFG